MTQMPNPNGQGAVIVGDALFEISDIRLRNGEIVIDAHAHDVPPVDEPSYVVVDPDGRQVYSPPPIPHRVRWPAMGGTKFTATIRVDQTTPHTALDSVVVDRTGG